MVKELEQFNVPTDRTYKETVELEGPARAVIGRCGYSADVRHMLGEIKGPNPFNEMLVAYRIHYSEKLNSSIVEWALATIQDYERAFNNG